MPPRRDDHLRGEITVEFNGVMHKREFTMSSSLGKMHGNFEPKDWPINQTGTRMLAGGMRSEVGYMVQKTAEECLRHVLYEMTGRY